MTGVEYFDRLVELGSVLVVEIRQELIGMGLSLIPLYWPGLLQVIFLDCLEALVVSILQP